MTNKTIQVPMDQELLGALQQQCRKEGRSRAELIRKACRRYLAEVEEAELDRIYVEGYRRIPEDTAIAESQARMLKRILPKEKW